MRPLQRFPLRSGDMRHLVTFQIPVRSQSAENAPVVSWATLYSCKAMILEMKRTGYPQGREYDYAGQLRADATHLIVTRAFSLVIYPEMRLVFGTRVFNILIANVTDQIRHELMLEVRENRSALDSATATYTVKLDGNGQPIFDPTTNTYLVVGGPMAMISTVYPWGEIDFTAAQSLAIAAINGTFFPNRLAGAVTTLTGNVLTQPTINLGIASNHTKYLSGRTFTELATLLHRQEFETMLADAGETDIWLEIATGGTVDAGAYRGMLYVTGDRIG